MEIIELESEMSETVKWNDFFNKKSIWFHVDLKTINRLKGRFKVGRPNCRRGKTLLLLHKFLDALACPPVRFVVCILTLDVCHPLSELRRAAYGSLFCNKPSNGNSNEIRGRNLKSRTESGNQPRQSQFIRFSNASQSFCQCTKLECGYVQNLPILFSVWIYCFILCIGFKYIRSIQFRRYCLESWMI